MPTLRTLALSIMLFILGCSSGSHQFQGYVEGELIFLSSPYSGVLETQPVHRGETVKKGQLLFKLDEAPQSMQVTQAMQDLQEAQNTLTDLEKPRRPEEITAIEAQIKQVDADIALAALRVNRNETLYKRQAIDKDSLDAALSSLQKQKELKAQYEANLALAKLGDRQDQILSQKSRVNALKAKLKQAQWDLAQKTGVAPASGILFDTYFKEGEFVGSQQPVLSLLTPENVRIEFFIPVDFVKHLHLDQQIEFTCMNCASKNIATINYISPVAEYLPPLVYSRENADNLVFKIQAHIQDGLKFKPGQPVTITLP